MSPKQGVMGCRSKKFKMKNKPRSSLSTLPLLINTNLTHPTVQKKRERRGEQQQDGAMMMISKLGQSFNKPTLFAVIVAVVEMPILPPLL